MNAHCWEDGPKICREHGVACDDFRCETVGTSCMLEDGHEGPHEFCRDDEITVAFK